MTWRSSIEVWRDFQETVLNQGPQTGSGRMKGATTSTNRGCSSSEPTATVIDVGTTWPLMPSCRPIDQVTHDIVRGAAERPGYIRKAVLDLPVLLPGALDGRDRCVDRLMATPVRRPASTRSTSSRQQIKRRPVSACTTTRRSPCWPGSVRWPPAPAHRSPTSSGTSWGGDRHRPRPQGPVVEGVAPVEVEGVIEATSRPDSSRSSSTAVASMTRPCGTLNDRGVTVERIPAKRV